MWPRHHNFSFPIPSTDLLSILLSSEQTEVLFLQKLEEQSIGKYDRHPSNVLIVTEQPVLCSGRPHVPTISDVRTLRHTQSHLEPMLDFKINQC